jgi:ABC-2 type transport system permease protein
VNTQSSEQRARKGGRLVRTLRRLAYQTWNNPIVIKELRGRMRGWRAATVLIIHLSVLACFASSIYLIIAESASLVGGGQIGQTMGQTLFYSTYLVQLVLVVFLSPAFTAGAISGERERKTIDLLITTLLPSHSLVLGKLISALAYIILLILAALPIQSLALMFGGIVPSEVIIGTILLLITALIAGSVGIFVSSLMRSSIASTVLTYAAILLATVGIPIAVGVALGLFNAILGRTLDSLSWIWQAALVYVGGFLLCTNPFATVFMTKAIQDEQGSLFLFTTQVSSGSATRTIPLISPWVIYVLFYTAVSGLLILSSILIIRHKRG